LCEAVFFFFRARDDVHAARNCGCGSVGSSSCALYLDLLLALLHELGEFA
jgi:hypothetical protein